MEFTNNGVTYIYEPTIITIQQAVVADEIVTYVGQVRQRADATLDKISKSGTFDWLPKCAGALLVKKTESGNESWNFLAWDAAEQFVRKLPVSEYSRLQECLEHFFLSMKKGEMLSMALGNPISQANNLGHLLSQMKQLSDNLSKRK